MPRVQGKGVQVNGLPTIECSSDHPSIWEAATLAGYVAPDYRVGTVAHAKPRPGEVVVAQVRASRYGLSVPIFGKNKGDKGRI